MEINRLSQESTDIKENMSKINDIDEISEGIFL